MLESTHSILDENALIVKESHQGVGALQVCVYARAYMLDPSHTTTHTASWVKMRCRQRG